MKSIIFKTDPKFESFLKSKTKELQNILDKSKFQKLVIHDDYYLHNCAFSMPNIEDSLLIHFGTTTRSLGLNVQLLELNDSNITTFNLDSNEYLTLGRDYRAETSFTLSKQLNFTSGIYFEDKNSINKDSEGTRLNLIMKRKNIILDKKNPYENRYFNAFYVKYSNRVRLQVTEHEINETNLEIVLNLVKKLWN